MIFPRLRKYLDELGNKYIKNFSIQFLGVLGAQILPLAVSPLLTRLYGPEEFASLATFMAVGAIVTVVAGGRYQYAIIYSNDCEEAKYLLVISLILTGILCLLISILCIIGFFFPILESIYRNPLLIYVPIYLLFFGFWSSYSLYAARENEFRLSSISRFVQSVSYVILAILLAFLKFPLGLIISRASSPLGSWIILYLKYKNLYDGISTRELWKTAKKYLYYPKYNLIPSLMDSASNNALIFFLTFYYSEEILGNMGITNLVILSPLGLIAMSMKDVFYKELSDSLKHQDLKKARRLFNLNAKFLFGIGLLPALVLLIFGKEIFILVFGMEWEIAGQFAVILAPTLLIKMVASPLSIVFFATNQVKRASFWQYLYFLTTYAVLGLGVLVLKLDIYSLLCCYMIHELALYTLYLNWQIKSLDLYSIEG